MDDAFWLQEANISVIAYDAVHEDYVRRSDLISCSDMESLKCCHIKEHGLGWIVHNHEWELQDSAGEWDVSERGLQIHFS